MKCTLNKHVYVQSIYCIDGITDRITHSQKTVCRVGQAAGMCREMAWLKNLGLQTDGGAGVGWLSGLPN